MPRFFRAAALALAFAFALPALAKFSHSPSVAVSVGTSATILAPAGFAFVMVCNQDASKTLFWSWNDTGLTTASGAPLLPGQCLQWTNIGSDQVLRGITTAGTVDARVAKSVGNPQ